MKILFRSIQDVIDPEILEFNSIDNALNYAKSLTEEKNFIISFDMTYFTKEKEHLNCCAGYWKMSEAVKQNLENCDAEVVIMDGYAEAWR